VIWKNTDRWRNSLRIINTPLIGFYSFYRLNMQLTEFPIGVRDALPTFESTSQLIERNPSGDRHNSYQFGGFCI
jgi:hypothetical protein